MLGLQSMDFEQLVSALVLQPDRKILDRRAQASMFPPHHRVKPFEPGIENSP
jgi:hypothetical protein